MLGLKYPRVLQLVPDSVVGQERSPLLVPPPASFPDLAEAKARRIAAGRGCRCPFEAGRRPRVKSQAAEEYLGGR